MYPDGGIRLARLLGNGARSIVYRLKNEASACESATACPVKYGI
jgi:hypothetical protein